MTSGDFAPREEISAQEAPKEEHFRSLFAEAGIDTDPSKTHHIQYVSGLPADYNLDDYPTFDQFHAEQSAQSLLSQPYPAVSIYNGPFTPTEIMKLRDGLKDIFREDDELYLRDPRPIEYPPADGIFGRRAERMSPEAILDVIRAKQPENEPLTPAVEQKISELLADPSFPLSGAATYVMNHLAASAAEESAPISTVYHYGGGVPPEVKVPYLIEPDQKVAYWIDGIYGGTITQHTRYVSEDRSLGSRPHVSTQLTVRGELAKRWDWDFHYYAIDNDYKIDSAPDDFIRGTLLQENIGQVHVNSNGFVEDTLREPYELHYRETPPHPDAAIAPYSVITQDIARLRHDASNPTHSPRPEVDISRLLGLLKLTERSWEDYGTTQSEIDILARMSYRQGAVYELQNIERLYKDEILQGVYPLREKVLELLRKGAATPAHIGTTLQEINKLDATVNGHRGDNTLASFRSFVTVRRHTFPYEEQLRIFDRYADQLRTIGGRLYPERVRPYGISDEGLMAKRRTIETTPAPLKGLARILGKLGLGSEDSVD